MFTVELLSSPRLWVKGDFRCTVNSERSCTGAPRRLWFHNQTATTSYSSTVMSPNIFFFCCLFIADPVQRHYLWKPTQQRRPNWFPGTLHWTLRRSWCSELGTQRSLLMQVKHLYCITRLCTQTVTVAAAKSLLCPALRSVFINSTF